MVKSRFLKKFLAGVTAAAVTLSCNAFGMLGQSGSIVAKAESTEYVIFENISNSGSVTKNPYGNDYIIENALSGSSIPSALSNNMGNFSSLVFNVDITVNSLSGSNVGLIIFAMDNSYIWHNKPIDGSATTGNYSLSMDITSLSSLNQIGVRFATNDSGASVSYTINSAKVVGESGSSSGGSSSGGSSGNSGSKLSDTINVSKISEFNYAKLLQESLYFYDANMCGPDVDSNSAFTWRSACHTADQNTSVTIDGTTYSVDVSGGFHDAGDHAKFGLPQGYAASTLALSYYEFKDAFNALGQTEHLKLILDHFCDYFKRCTVYNTSGDVAGFVYQVGEKNSDHNYWGAPENQSGSRQVFVASGSNPATDEVSVAVAALALNYVNFGNEEYLSLAKDLF
ncbi:MAG: glycoside hydrolase family 9 protein, partial [Lachnospiraceae bacterium]|nr:glycoside hydrolase family 9 protein [Lachnospiraceae bacterium]